MMQFPSRLRLGHPTAPCAMFAHTRDQAFARLQDFIPYSGKYSRDRNFVFPYEHSNVSRLSPAIRHRLITEEEAAQAPLTRYALSTTEKFRQEIYWRRYWKSWLSLRPQVWDHYLDELAYERETLSSEDHERISQIWQGNSEIAIMNLFTRELLETGYLHNHARMWWAGWWIHVARLPWQLGADFFYQHLLDADPASNTLSWRWVAGLQTRGKSYLPRRSNLEKHLPVELLAQHQKGLSQLEQPKAWKPESYPEKALITCPELTVSQPDALGSDTLILHEEDLSPETSPLTQFEITRVFVVADRETWQRESFSEKKRQWLEAALRDVHQRARQQFPQAEVHPEILTLDRSLTDKLITDSHPLVLRPETGHLAATFSHTGIDCHWIDRSEDLALRPLATAGFFGFWKKLQNQQSALEA